MYEIYLTRTHVAHFQMLTSCYFLKLFSGLALTKCFREKVVNILFCWKRINILLKAIILWSRLARTVSLVLAHHWYITSLFHFISGFRRTSVIQINDDVRWVVALIIFDSSFSNVLLQSVFKSTLLHWKKYFPSFFRAVQLFFKTVSRAVYRTRDIEWKWRLVSFPLMNVARVFRWVDGFYG